MEILDDLKQFESLMKHLGSKFISDGYGTLYLQFSALLGKENAVKFLLKNGCDVNARDPQGDTALMVAVARDHEAIVKILLKAGADIDILNKDNKSVLQLFFSRNHVPIGILTLLLHAVMDKCGSSENTAKYLIDAGCRLYQCIILQNFAVVKYMIDHGISIHARCPENQQTPLHVACSVCDPVIVSLLMEHGADSKALDIWEAIPVYYLYLNDQKNNPEKLEILKILSTPGECLTQCTDDGTFQISDSLVDGDREVIQVILQSNLDFTAKDKLSEWNILHYLARNVNAGVVEELKFYANKLNVNAVDKFERNALFPAVNEGNFEMVKFLLEEGADPNMIDTGDGITPVYLAHFEPGIGLDHQYEQCALLLLQYGADPQFMKEDDGVLTTLFDFVWETDSSNRMEAVVAHIAMLERCGKFVSVRILLKIYSKGAVKKYFERCKRVLDRKFNDSVTILELLTASKQKMAKYIDNELIIKLNCFRIKNKLKLIYPYYFETLGKRIKEGREYQKAIVAICKIFENRIDQDHLIVSAIMEYLDDKSIRMLFQYSQLYNK